MRYLEAVPAYGRDYKTQKEVRDAWEAGKDFQIQAFGDPDDGRYVNKASDPKGVVLNVRYAKLTKVCVIKLK